jgi:hypothetical protein
MSEPSLQRLMELPPAQTPYYKLSICIHPDRNPIDSQTPHIQARYALSFVSISIFSPRIPSAIITFPSFHACLVALIVFVFHSSNQNIEMQLHDNALLLVLARNIFFHLAVSRG